MTDIKKKIGEVSNNLSKEIELIHTVTTDLLNKTSDPGKEVGFSATLLGHTTTSSAIVFNNLITNIGGGYNSSNGMFHCPRPGLYLFSSTLTSVSTTYVAGYLMKNGKQITRFQENSKGGHPSASLTLALRLNREDKVWIKGFGIKYYAPDNAFAGVLIKP